MMLSEKNFKINCPVKLSFLSGLLLSLSFTYESLWFVAFFALIPFCAALNTENITARKRFGLSMVFSFGYNGTLLVWLLQLSEVLPVGTLTGMLLLYVGVLLISFILGIYIATAMAFYKKNEKPVVNALLFASFYMLAEFLQGAFPPLSFPWGRLCAILTPFTAFIQSASLFGGLFVSLLCAFINALLYEAITSALSGQRSRLRICTACAAAVLAANSLFGCIRVALYDNAEKNNAVLVQGNYSGLSKWSKPESEIMNTYFTYASELADENTKYIVFPETAIPIYLFEDKTALSRFTELAEKSGATVITGIRYRTVPDNSRDDCLHYNAMVAIEPNGRVSEPYFKQVLVPLGEFIPFSDYFKKNHPDIMNVVGYYSAGEDNGSVELSDRTVGCVICYESIYPDIAHESVKDGASLIFLISNDSWFGRSAALRQHHSHAILRAVENGRYVLRASSTAITSSVNPVGQVENTAPALTAAAIRCTYEETDARTLYSYIGDAVALLPISILVFRLCIYIKKKKVLQKNAILI